MQRIISFLMNKDNDNDDDHHDNDDQPDCSDKPWGVRRGHTSQQSRE